MKLTENQIKRLDSIVDESLDIILAENEYQEFMREKMRQHNIKSPFELQGEERKQFFAEIKRDWAKHKKDHPKK